MQAAAVGIADNRMQVFFAATADAGETVEGSETGCGEYRVEKPEAAWFENFKPVPEFLS